MSSGAEGNDSKRRRLLLGATGLVGVFTGGTVSVPFLGSLRPSRKTLSAGKPVKIVVEGIRPGELKKTIWRSKPIWIFGRDNEMLAQAESEKNLLLDPDSDSSLQPEYCKNEMRSIRSDIFVAVGLCTHLGCIPGRDESEEAAFLCACHGSRFDVAGRVYKGSPAPSNLIIPPHYFDNEGTLVIGEDSPVGNS